MKKRLEADLISIAHRILQLKNKSDINQLYLETQKLYEKLAVLRFVDAQFGDIKPTIGQAEIEKQIEEVFETIENAPIASVVIEEIIEIPEATTETTDSEIEAEKEEIIIEEIVEEPIAEEEIVAEEEAPSEDLSFQPSFELTEEEPEEEVEEVEEIKKPEVVQISFEDLLGGNYDEAQFVKVHPVENIPTAIAIDFEEKELIPIPEINIEEPE